MSNEAAEHRERPERRGGGDRRRVVVVVTEDRRAGSDRRAEERRSQEAVGGHIRNALALITHVADADELDDEHRRELDTAMLRLRFALDRLNVRTEV